MARQSRALPALQSSVVNLYVAMMNSLSVIPHQYSIEFISRLAIFNDDGDDDDDDKDDDNNCEIF